jgi:hypothetical protein
VRADGSWHEDRFDGAPPSQGTVRG